MTVAFIPSRRRRVGRLVHAITIAAFAIVVLAGTAHAGSWAQVNDDGTLAKSRGVLANFHDGPGLYRIVFRKKLDNCVPILTVIAPFAFASAYATDNPGEVAVAVVNTFFTEFVDASFSIALVC